MQWVPLAEVIEFTIPAMVETMVELLLALKPSQYQSYQLVK